MGIHFKHLKRVELKNHVRYLTFSCYHQLPLFKNDKIKQLFVERLYRVTQAMSVDLIAWIVMPDHVHLMIIPDTEQSTVTSFLQALKRPVSVKVLQRWRQLNAEILSRVTDAKGKQHFWQQGGGYDRNITSSEELEEIINYIHQNPMRRGLVKLANDWNWSSAGYYTTGQYEGPPIKPIQI